MVVRPGFVRTRMTAGLPEPPLATSAAVVARATSRGLRRRARTVWAPSALRWVTAALRMLPHARLPEAPGVSRPAPFDTAELPLRRRVRHELGGAPPPARLLARPAAPAAAGGPRDRRARWGCSASRLATGRSAIAALGRAASCSPAAGLALAAETLRPRRRRGPARAARARSMESAVSTAASWPALGSTAVLRVRGPAALDDAVALVVAELARFDEACSRFREDSELVARERARGAVRRRRPAAARRARAGAARRAADRRRARPDDRALALEQAGYDRDWELLRACRPGRGTVPRRRA